MDLMDLPWWKYHNTVEYLSINMFLERIDKVPLNIELLESFLDDWVLKFDVADMSKSIYAMSYSIPSRAMSPGFSKFGFMINSNISLEDKANTLVHEAVRLIYKARDTDELEIVINSISNKFYGKNKDLCNSFVEKYLPKK